MIELQVFIELLFVNNIYYLLSATHVPGTVVNISHELSHLILIVTFSGRNYYFPHSVNEETKALRG